MECDLLKLFLRRILGPHISRSIKKILGCEKIDEVDLIYEALSGKIKSKVMVDVGAHFGGSLERFAHDGWRIYAFEPDPQNRAILSSYCRNISGVTIDSRAVSNQDNEDRPFYKSEVSTGISSLSSFHSTHKQIGTVSTVTLKSIFRENDIKSLGFLKIDTEGHDLFVLQGMPWENVKPDVILCEFEDRKTKSHGYDFNDMASYLVDKGYKILVSEWYPIVEYGGHHQWRRFVQYPCELLDELAWGNLIAIKDNKLFDEISHKAELFAERYR